MGKLGKTKFSLINKPQLITKSWVTTNQRFIKSNLNDNNNMMVVMNCLRLSTHLDFDHLHHYFENDQKKEKSLSK